MKELEFRFYIEREKRFIYSDKYESLSEFFKDYEYQNEITNVSNIMQYTGVKDKNNKKIYEGDIIADKQVNFTFIRGEVVFDDGGFYIKEIDKDGICDYEPLTNLHSNSYTIIGNKFEKIKKEEK
jgi:hypothetical protein